MITTYKVLLLCGTMLLSAFGCVKYETLTPGIAVYKTKGDYFNNVSVGINKEGKLYHCPSYYNPRYNSIDYRIKITEDDTIYAWRVKLINGYIVSEEIGDNSIFLDFTFKEFLIYEMEVGEPLNILSEHILDDDPFLELYIDRNKPRKYELSDTALINQMIRDDELGIYFERVK